MLLPKNEWREGWRVQGFCVVRNWRIHENRMLAVVSMRWKELQKSSGGSQTRKKRVSAFLSSRFLKRDRGGETGRCAGTGV